MTQPLLTFRMNDLAHVPGANMEVNLVGLPVRDANGHRVIVGMIRVECDFVLTTAVGETLSAYDLSSLLQQIDVKDSQGIRRSLTGTQARVHGLMELGLHYPADPATFPASQNAVQVIYTHAIPFVRPKAHRDRDYGIPADDLVEGSIKLRMPRSSDVLCNGGDGVTIVSGTYRVYLDCYTEHDIQLKVRDCVTFAEPQSAVDLLAPIGGALVRGITLVKEAEGTIVTGGTTVTTIDNITMAAYDLTNIPRKWFKEFYLHSARQTWESGRDPVYNDRALPLVCPPAGSKIPDMLLVLRDLLIRLGGSTFTSPTLILDRIESRSDAYVRRVCERFKLPAEAGNSSKMKLGKFSGRSNPNDWGDYRAFMAQKLA